MTPEEFDEAMRRKREFKSVPDKLQEIIESLQGVRLMIVKYGVGGVYSTQYSKINLERMVIVNEEIQILSQNKK